MTSMRVRFEAFAMPQPAVGNGWGCLGGENVAIHLGG